MDHQLFLSNNFIHIIVIIQILLIVQKKIYFVISTLK